MFLQTTNLDVENLGDVCAHRVRYITGQSPNTHVVTNCLEADSSLQNLYAAIFTSASIIFPIPSCTSCTFVSHMNAGVVTTLLCSST